MRQGEVWMVDFEDPSGPEQAGIRPAIVLQNNALNHDLVTSIVVPLTTKTKRLAIPTTVFFPAGEAGLTRDSVALCHQVQVRGRARFLSLLGVLSPTRLAEVQTALLDALDL
ncbi:MAG: type II toxin-antitoxin system PemK/MazF family toxin [Janthinobacterium lividum]